MASVKKPKGKSKYRIWFTNEHGVRDSAQGFRDKQASQALAQQLERDAERRRAGLPVADAANLATPVTDLIARHVADLHRQGALQNPRHYRERQHLLEHVAAFCGWTTLASVRGDDFQGYLQHATHAGLAPATINRHHKWLNRFLADYIRPGWLDASPLAHVKPTRLGSHTRRRQRCAYTHEQLQLLLAAVPEGRALVYHSAALCGFRRNELRHMQKQDLNPHERLWRPRPDILKAKRHERLPMLPDCADLLMAPWQALRRPTDVLLPPIPEMRTLHADLARAGIARQDDQGRWLDFHSFRYFFCTQLARILPIQKVMMLMRHKSILLTANLYLDLGLTDVAEDNWTLPRLFPENQP